MTATGRSGKAGAWVAHITGLLDLSSWPAGMRVIVRKERPHPVLETSHCARSPALCAAVAVSCIRLQPARELGDLRARSRLRTPGSRCEHVVRARICTVARMADMADLAKRCYLLCLACGTIESNGRRISDAFGLMPRTH